ncbi:hypothetical protein BG261_05495 [Floricoccus tropicus]|uniref:DUF2187 domain-containing protein n=1 Tax=Floricoccus tropicus TaxID=1859473 RepID=A0A1E8GKS2_9LACT|nr:hypothetical protein [Floricoccus tropicus]OFI48844.1 hypothetical protein BG261_05495 [Floricoccus tropicus]
MNIDLKQGVRRSEVKLNDVYNARTEKLQYQFTGKVVGLYNKTVVLEVTKHHKKDLIEVLKAGKRVLVRYSELEKLNDQRRNNQQKK